MPHELINAIPVGLVSGDRIVAEKVQKRHIEVKAPTVEKISPKNRTSGVVERATRTQPVAARTMGVTMCQVRSPRLSELALHRGIAIAAQIAGMPLNRPVYERLHPVNTSRTIWGTQVVIVFNVNTSPK